MTLFCSQNTIYLANKPYDCPTYSSIPLTFCAPLGKSSLTFCCYVLFVRTCIHVHNLKQHPQKYHLPFLREGLEAHQLGQTGKIAKPRILLPLPPQSWYLLCMLPGPPFLHGLVKTRASHRQSRHFTKLSPQLLICVLYFFSKPYLCFKEFLYLHLFSVKIITSPRSRPGKKCQYSPSFPSIELHFIFQG